MSKRTAIRAGAIALGAASAGVLVGTGFLFALIELDDGRHDIFGPDLPSADSPAQPHRPSPVR